MSMTPSHDLYNPDVPPPPSNPASHLPGPLSPPTCSSSPPGGTIGGDPLASISAFVKALPFQQRDLILKDFSDRDLDRFLSELEHPRDFDSKTAESLRYDYNPDTETLKIRATSVVHNTITKFLCDTCFEMLRRGFITEKEWERLHPDFGTNKSLYNQGKKCLGKRRKRSAAIKQPDGALYVDNHHLPCVVFEVEFSDSHTDGVSDVEQWLEWSRGQVKVAILITIIEHPKNINVNTSSINDDGGHGDSKAEERERSDRESDNSTPSPGSFYSELESKCVVDEWVGPISAFARVYRYDSNSKSAYMVGDKITIIPSTESLSPLLPSDLSGLKLSTQDLFPDAPPSDCRTFTLDMDLYASDITAARKDLAVGRMILQQEQWEET